MTKISDLPLAMLPITAILTRKPELCRIKPALLQCQQNTFRLTRMEIFKRPHQMLHVLEYTLRANHLFTFRSFNQFWSSKSLGGCTEYLHDGQLWSEPSDNQITELKVIIVHCSNRLVLRQERGYHFTSPVQESYWLFFMLSCSNPSG